MRHGKKFNHLGRQAPHRKSMLSNMSASLILHKRISTTLAKAKELKKHVEPLVTRAKEDTTHNRRVAFSFLQSKEAIKTLFGDVAEKVGSRPGGYTRIIKTGFRLGDNAEMCIIELVDFNELMLKEAKPAKKTTRRSRRGSGKAAGDETSSAEQSDQEATENKAGEKSKAKPKSDAKEAIAEKAVAEDAADQKEEDALAADTPETAPKAEKGKADQKEEDTSAGDTPETAPKVEKGKADQKDDAEGDKKAE